MLTLQTNVHPNLVQLQTQGISSCISQSTREKINCSPEKLQELQPCQSIYYHYKRESECYSNQSSSSHHTPCGIRSAQSSLNILESLILARCPPYHLSIYLPTYLPTSLSIYLSVYLLIYLSIYISTYLPTFLSLYLSAYLSIYLSTYLPTYLLTYLPSYLSICGFAVLCWTLAAFERAKILRALDCAATVIGPSTT
jgi:hypothetical protein